MLRTHSLPTLKLCGVALRAATFKIMTLALLPFLFAPFAFSGDVSFGNAALTVKINAADGSYTIGSTGAKSPIIQADVAAELDHHWIKCSDYPHHDAIGSDLDDALGTGKQMRVVSKGLTDRPDLIYTIRLYKDSPYGEIQVELKNRTQQSFQVQSLRSVEATGSAILDLHASPASDRVLSDSYSEDWPPLQIYDLGKAPDGMHRAVGSQLVYNQKSKESIFFGALTADRLLTILHLKTGSGSSGPTIAAFTVESTGTTEIQATEEGSGMREGDKENLIELNLPLAAGGSVSAERLMFAAGSDYHA